MKKSIINILASLMLLVLTACGGGSSSDNGSNSAVKGTQIKSMKIGTLYTIEKGNKIVKKSEKPIVILETNTQTGVTTATLTEGEADIVS
jgi:ABC-type Fe3+-citrate transport system substrate-binding protein